MSDVNPQGGRVSLAELFGASRPVVGMVHLEALPGAPRWGGTMDGVLERALADVWALEEGGVDGILVENFGDVPFHPGAVPPETVAAMAVVAAAVVRAAEVPVGVNVLRNDASGALGVAVAAGARFIRVNVHTGVMFTDQGVIEGRADETLRRRAALGAEVAVLADVLVKHGAAPAGVEIEDAARDCWERGLADGLIGSGAGTGEPTEPAELMRIKEAAPGAPVWVGSGASANTVAELLAVADGVVVGSAFQEGGRAGRPVDVERVRRFVEAADVARG